MASISTKFGLGGGVGVNFKEPWKLKAYTPAATQVSVKDSGGTSRTSATTEFFTEMARRGLQDTTNWTADTYKTLLTVSSGKGEVVCLVGCTAGGAETTTFEITVDGVLKELVVGAMASGDRAIVTAGGLSDADFYASATNIGWWTAPGAEALNAGKTFWDDRAGVSGGVFLPPWNAVGKMSTPLLQFDTSLLIRAKHSATITNSTATAYSAVQYRLGL